MAFYGRRWEDVSAHLGPRTGPVTAMTYATIESLIGTEGWEQHWDDAAHVPYLLNPGEEVFISYDDEESIKHKVDYIVDRDLAGVIIWEISQDFTATGEQALLDAAGELLRETVAREDGKLLPGESAFLPNYPNPFSISTRIPFRLDRGSHVVIEVFDVLGRRVATLLDETLPAGRHAVVWDSNDNAGGLYVCRMLAGSSTYSTTMNVMR